MFNCASQQCGKLYNVLAYTILIVFVVTVIMIIIIIVIIHSNSQTPSIPKWTQNRYIGECAIFGTLS